MEKPNKQGMFTRIYVGVLLAVLFIATLFFGGVIQQIFSSIIFLLCVHEVKNACVTKGYKPFFIPLYIFALLACPVYVMLGGFYLALFLLATVLFTLSFLLFSAKYSIGDLFVSLALFVYPTVFLMLLVLAINLESFALSRVAMLLLFACPLLCDTFAYFVGVFFGRHKLNSRISPKKTVEGSVGGLIGGALGGVLVYFFQSWMPYIWNIELETTLPLVPLILIGIVLSFAGQMGDLLASAIKRWASIKDFSTFFPGHGGVTDRIDSVLLCAPIVFIMFYYLDVWL